MSQTAKILSHLKEGRTLSPLQALDLYGCFRLGARIYDLRHGHHDGTKYDIREVPHEGKQYAIYKLAEVKQGTLL